ncbi:ExbD/TolR family protein [Celeribacter sp.]|uniref:ExbD/TolR family protein n=1 Tax=Celeribacter sp. TaxID=1890673 RepID=UPI003A91DBAC
MKGQRLHPPELKIKLDSSLAIVNIVLLLIFFFLTTGSLIGAGEFQVRLPETEDLPLDLLPKPLLIVEGDGAMVLDGEPVAPGTLNDLLIDHPVLHVLADRETRAFDLLDALAAEQLIAVEIRLVTLHRSAEDGV